MSELSTPGTEINQYRIVKYLGSGLFAETYLATHTFLEIDRAIKVLHRGTNSPEMFANYKERYKQEWQLAAGIRHPNLVEVYEIVRVGGVNRIMFDNFQLPLLKEAVAIVNNQFETEASGGVTLLNVRKISQTGVQYISVGALTHSAGQLDISMKIILPDAK